MVDISFMRIFHDNKFFRLSLVKANLSCSSFMNMHSQLKTPVAVLRQQLGLNAEEFGELIGKSVSTVTKLENGLLKLSEETAFLISQKTCVDMQWLLDGKSDEAPYYFDPFDPLDYTKREWTKEIFEVYQSRTTHIPAGYGKRVSWNLAAAVQAVTDLLAVYHKAAKEGKGELALYLIKQCSRDLVERLGKDDKAFLRTNAKAKLITRDGTEWQFTQNEETGAIQLVFRGEYIYEETGKED